RRIILAAEHPAESPESSAPSAARPFIRAGILGAAGALDSGLVNLLSGRGVEAIGDSAADRIEPAVVIRGSADAASIAPRPDDVRLGDVSFAARADRDRASVAAFDRVDDAVVRDDAGTRRIGLVRFAIPKQLARIGIEAPDFEGHAQDEFLPAVGQIDEHRRSPGGAEAFGFFPPDDGARLLVERDETVALDGGGNDHQILVENRARRRAPAAPIVVRADARLPKLTAVLVEGQNARLAEEHE